MAKESEPGKDFGGGGGDSGNGGGGVSYPIFEVEVSLVLEIRSVVRCQTPPPFTSTHYRGQKGDQSNYSASFSGFTV